MPNYLDSLATVLILAALVGIFLVFSRHNRSPRFKLWTLGWVVMFFHVVTDAFVPSGPFRGVVLTVHLASLAVAGMFFLVSVSALLPNPRWKWALLLGTGTPMFASAALVAFEVRSELICCTVAALVYLAGAGTFIAWHRKITPYVATMAVLVVGAGAYGVWLCFAGDYIAAFTTMLMVVYGTCGILTFRAYHRFSAGAVLTGLGFLCWASVWAFATFAPEPMSKIGLDNTLWNVPKLFVAFGMILIELEERSMAARQSQFHERQLTQQMSRFSDLTAKIVAHDDVAQLCPEISSVITDVSNYERVAILLTDDAGRLYLAGNAGMSTEAESALHHAVSQTTVKDVEELCASGRRLGPNSFICSRRMTERHKSIRSIRHYPANPYWSAGEELVVPLRSPQGNMMGCLSLDDPKDVYRVVRDEISALELLASNIAAALEKTALQRKMLTHEKLASIGQLVGGVAHELNNPLTVLIGYAELLGDSELGKAHEREISTLRREAHRMRTTIDNLLRFARQSKSETNTANIAQVLTDAVALRDYEMSRKGVRIECDIPTNIPQVLIDEAQLKTVLVNLISNAFDAVVDAPEKRINVFVRKVTDRVLVSVIDTGKGFKDVSRAFDPFFSTKEIGRGTGLGLSVCYGIVKQHGGEIYAQNVNPVGACVTMELRGVAEGEKSAADTTAFSAGAV